MKTIYLDNNATTRTRPRCWRRLCLIFTSTTGTLRAPTLSGAGSLESSKKPASWWLPSSVRSPRRSFSQVAERKATTRRSLGPGNPERQAAHRHEQGGAPRRPVPLHPPGRQRLPCDRDPCGPGRSHGHGALSTKPHPDTAVVTLMWANNETGVLFPVEEAARIAHERGILFHTDAVQVVGKMPIRLAESAVDMLSLSGHKLHGPKGVGVLYVRKGNKFSPLIIGGHQERGAGAARKTRPASSAWARHASWRLFGWRRKTLGSKPSGTSWKTG
jgi:cysteine desulfurase